MASKYEIWAPLSDLESDDRYLYHYTKIDTCFKILYYQTLQFSSIGCTNDIFEQKPKVCYASDDMKMQQKFDKLQRALKERRTQMQLLCFSRDLPKQHCTVRDEADVIGRGFALPRMWAQYAQNNQGVCLIINKDILMEQLEKKKIKCWAHPVEYCDAYKVYPLTDCDINDLEQNWDNPSVLKNNEYVRLNYFSKLKDWESEREYRIVASCANDANIPIKVGNLYDYLEGVIVGQNCDEVYCYLLKALCDPKQILVRKIYFDYTITSIHDVCMKKERGVRNVFEA